MPSSFIKDPDATLDYTWDWGSWLTSPEVISSYVIDADAGITVDSDSNDNTTVTAWLSGGTADTQYVVRCEITTDSSPARVDERSMKIRVRER